MDIAELSMVMSQSRVQQSAGIQLEKIAIDTENKTGIQTPEIVKNVEVDPDLGNNLDIRI